MQSVGVIEKERGREHTKERYNKEKRERSNEREE
jgi:hypothetical protein